MKTYGTVTEREIKNVWTFDKVDRYGRNKYVSPDRKYKIYFYPNTLFSFVVKNRWYIRG